MRHFLLIFLFSLQTLAQTDLSSDALLKKSKEAEPSMDFGRFKVINQNGSTNPLTPSPLSQPKKKKVTLDLEAQEAYRPDATSVRIEKKSVEPVTKPVEPKPEVTEPKPEEPAKVVEAPPLSEQVKYIILGAEVPDIEEYREQVHPDDNRLNRAEIFFAPGLLSNKSSSNMNYRDYLSNSPVFELGLKFWATPFLGLSASYLGSLSSDLDSVVNAGEKISVKHEYINFGLFYRKFFGLSRKANSMTFGFHFSDNRLKVPSTDLSRVNLRTTGYGLMLEARVPVSPTYSWFIGGTLDPKLSHTEETTGLFLQSGSSVESTKVSTFVGGEIKFNRKNVMIWKLQYSLEKNQFNGLSNIPAFGQSTPINGVSVDNAMTLFNFGYFWGL